MGHDRANTGVARYPLRGALGLHEDPLRQGWRRRHRLPGIGRWADRPAPVHGLGHPDRLHGRRTVPRPIPTSADLVRPAGPLRHTGDWIIGPRITFRSAHP